MSTFNYTEYLKNNPLLQKETKDSLLTESIEPVEKKSNKMKVSELKAKIKEDIMSTLQEQDADSLEDELMADLDESLYESLSESLSPGLESQLMDDLKIIEGIFNYYKEGIEFDGVDQTKEVLDFFLKNIKQMSRYTGVNEAKEEEEEEVEVEVEDEAMEDENDLGGGDAESLDPEAGLSSNESDIQNALKVAYDNAVALGDEKLSDQIGNTITMFTRTRVVNR